MKVGVLVTLREESRWNNGAVGNPIGIVAPLACIANFGQGLGVKWPGKDYESYYSRCDLVDLSGGE